MNDVQQVFLSFYRDCRLQKSEMVESIRFAMKWFIFNFIQNNS